MLGWHITIARQRKGGATPASFGEETTEKLAVWQAGVSGLDWLDALVKEGHAIDLGGNGYPYEYTAQIQYLTSQVMQDPPSANPVWNREPGDIVTDQWLGKTTIQGTSLQQCGPEEWVHIRVWDES